MKISERLTLISFGILVPLLLWPLISERFVWSVKYLTMLATQPRSHFRVTQKLKVDYSPHSFTEYVSDRTGMRVVVVDQKGPKVFGTFAVATEIFDDSGSPHTLEHLCFMGSRSYPYKGVLDQLATRAYSTTNAWTATDHTAYTLETAGYAAFAKILPIYLEHIILPTLTDSGCYTEVFHIDATGHDTGVVYSEMQGVQNSQSEIMELESNRLMYPEGIGFRYETGGMMEQLRVLKADRIRKFHRDMYQPKNLCLILVGEIDHDHLLATLDTFEAPILEHIPSPADPFKRPWTESKQPPPLAETTTKTIEFPEDDESMGEISVKYFGPSCNDLTQYTAISILLAYLAANSASILENILVEKEQLCTAVYYDTTPRPDSVIQFTLTGVETAGLEAVQHRFFELLEQAAKEDLDMGYLLDCLDRERRQQMFRAETSDQHYTTSIISAFLFSEDRSLADLANLEEFETLSRWTEAQWKECLRKWIVDAHKIVILGRPSAKLSKQLKDDEQTRVEKQIEHLGKEGLEQLERKLKNAQEENGRPIPDSILKGFEVPSTDTIHFMTTTPARSGEARKLGPFKNDIQKIIDSEKSDVPLYLHFENVPSNFVPMYLILGTKSIPVELRPLLPLYLENFFTSPVIRDGQRIEFEDVVKALERDTVGYEMSTGKAFGNGEVISLSFHVETNKYDLGIQWIRDLLWNSPFDVERLVSITSRLLQDIPDEKRQGDDMLYSIATMVQEKPESVSRGCNTLVKALYYKRVKKLLKSDPEAIISQLEKLRSSLTGTSNMRILVISDVEKLKHPVNAWSHLIKDNKLTRPLEDLDKRVDRLTDIGRNPGNHAYISPMPTIDSSYALAVGKGPDDPQDPRVPALMVATAYLDAIEGPLWTSVRGAGLAYGAGFNRRPGNIGFSVYRSPDSLKAFLATKQVLEDFVSGKSKIEAYAREGVVSTIVLGIASPQSTMANAAVDNFIKTVMRDLPRDWNNILLEKVRNVTDEEVISIMKDMLLPLFQPSTSNLFITCSTIMESKLVEGLTELGFHPEVRTLASFQDDYGLEADGSDDDEDSELGSDEMLDGSEQESGSDSENS